MGIGSCAGTHFAQEYGQSETVEVVTAILIRLLLTLADAGEALLEEFVQWELNGNVGES